MSDDPADTAPLVARFQRFLTMVGRSSSRSKLIRLAVAIVAVMVFATIGQIRLNLWQGAFYDAISRKNLPDFLWQLGVFGIIVSALLVLGVAQTWLHQMLKVRLREIVTGDLLEQWLKPKRAWRLSLTEEKWANPDQRIHEDAKRLAELAADLGVGLVQSGLLLLSFVGVLWSLSSKVVFVHEGEPFVIPGYMVWCALGYALTGSWLASIVGAPLIRRNAELRTREAELRFALVRVSETAKGVSIYGGEDGERAHLQGAMCGVIGAARALAINTTQLAWITAAYGWLALVAPIVVAAPGYFAGTMTFGDLMIVVGAFYQVQQSLRWYVDNFSGIAELSAMLSRVVGFHEALPCLDELIGDVSRIRCEEHPEGRLVMEGLSVLAPNGRIIADGDRIEVSPGERVRIIGEARSGKSTFFHALAELWPWGTGVLRRPPRGRIMYLPHQPYIPLGSLRAALTYPAPPGDFDDPAVLNALERIGLSHLAPSLDRVARWDKEMPLDEQQRVAYVRLLLHRPLWVIQDDALSELDETNRRLAYSIFKRELAGTALISIGGEKTDGDVYERTLWLRAEQPGLALPLQLSSEGLRACLAPVSAVAQVAAGG